MAYKTWHMTGISLLFSPSYTKFLGYIHPPPHPPHKCTVKIPGERPCFVFILDNYPSLIEDLCGFQNCLHVRFIQIVPLKKTDSGTTCQICGLNDWRAGPQKLRVSQIPLATLNSAWVFDNVWIKDLNTSFLNQVYSETKGWNHPQIRGSFFFAFKIIYFYFFPASLSYNWHITLYTFKM